MPASSANRIEPHADSLGQQDESDGHQTDESANQQRQDQEDLFFALLKQSVPVSAGRLPPDGLLLFHGLRHFIGRSARLPGKKNLSFKVCSRRRSSSKCLARAFSKSSREMSPRNFPVEGSTTGRRVTLSSAIRYTTTRSISSGCVSTVLVRTNSRSGRCNAASPSSSVRSRMSLRVSTPTNLPSPSTTGRRRWVWR